MSDPDSPKESLTFVVCALVIISIVIVLKLPWTSSLWLDETISVWIAQARLSELWQRSISFQGQSPLYFHIPWLMAQLGLVGEFWFRLPSALLVVGSAMIFYKTARLYFLTSVALFSTICFLALDPVQVAAMSTRPYALALFFTVALHYVWLSWFQKPQGKLLVWYGVFCTLLFYTHYLFAIVPVIHAGLVRTLYKKEFSIFKAHWLRVWIIAAVLAIPGVIQLVGLWGRKADLSFAPSPSVLQLFKMLIPPYLAVYLIMGALLVLIMGYGRGLHFPKYKYGRPHLVWAGFALGVLMFFVFSLVSDSPLFLDRIMLWYCPVLALLCGYLLARISPLPYRSLAICVVCGFIFFRETLRVWRGEFWREEIQMVQADSESELVLLYSGLVEAEQLGGNHPKLWNSYVAAPLSMYELSNKEVMVIPGEFRTKSSEEYWEQQVVPVLEHHDSGTLLCYRRKLPKGGQHTVQQVQSRLEQLGFTVTNSSPQNSIVQRLNFKREQVKKS